MSSGSVIEHILADLLCCSNRTVIAEGVMQNSAGGRCAGKAEVEYPMGLGYNRWLTGEGHVRTP
ncbi:MAG: hypothetical protein ACOC58_03610 [Chloroflexota bacterium]